MINAERVRFNKNLERFERPSVFSQHIIRYFPEVSMRNGHQGLSELARKNGLDPARLNPGEYLIFVNKEQTALKLYAPGNVIAHLKMPGSQRINEKTITLLPRFFNGSQINYNDALTAALKKYYRKA